MRLVRSLCVCAMLLGLVPLAKAGVSPESPAQSVAYTTQMLPLIQRYCLDCHSTEAHKGSLDLERFTTLAQVRRDVKPWQAMLEMLEAGEMPPKQKPQPTPLERRRLIEWVHSILNDEARARAGDPGPLPMRRLSNAEYDYTIRDLTGVDLHPAKEFPADGAAGEGFTNAAEGLTGMSPTLLNKYLLSAKEIAAHAVLLPDGIRFSPGKTRRDWSDQSLASLRTFYGQFTTDGQIPLQAYLAATLRHRDALLVGQTTLQKVAAKEKLNAKYFAVLWQTLIDDHRSFPLDSIRARWKQASENDSAALAANITAWQTKLWNVVAIGSYRNGNASRQVPNDAWVSDKQTMKLALKPAAGESDVTLYLSSREVFPTGKSKQVVWSRPRFEATGKPELLLRDYPRFGPAYEIDYKAVFADAAKYLDAVAETANDPKISAESIAQQDGLDLPRLKRWIEVAALEPRGKLHDDTEAVLRTVVASTLQPLTEQVTPTAERPAMAGWRKKGTDLPVVLSNSSADEEHIPGLAPPHKVVVHPTPTEFVAAVWKSPMEGRVRVTAHIAHAHPNCGNGVAWWLELRRADRAGVLAEGVIELGGQAQMPANSIKIARGDLLILAIDAKNGDHSCDLTQIDLTISTDELGKTWDLAGDVANNILDGNPHADKNGNKEVWSFVRGPTRPVGKGAATGAIIPRDSALGQWRVAVTDPARQEEAGKLAQEVQTLLSGARPQNAGDPNQILFDSLVSVDSALLRGLDLSAVGKQNPVTGKYGLDVSHFGVRSAGTTVDDASVVAPENSVIELHLPAALFKDRAFVVDGKLDSPDADGAVRFEVLVTRPDRDAIPPELTPVVASPGGSAYNQLTQGFDDFRRCFPRYICFPGVIPVDEVVCLKIYHREDEPLIRLFLDDVQRQQIDRLWEEHRFITQQPIAENKYLPLFIGFVTQDQPKELVTYFEGQRPAFQKRADDFEKDIELAVPRQLAALADFASRAYRRPLRSDESASLSSLYQTLRDKGASQEDAFRGVLARVLVAPSFLMRIEQSPPGKDAAPISDWELATRLSYFLWSSVPDDELRALAAARRLRDPVILAQQTQRMLKDNRVRALAIEFGTQWIHVRNFDTFNEKSEKLYPEFDQNLRSAFNEEPILFFQDLFQHEQPVTHILDADYTYLNEMLARHYGIPNVTGPQWRKVEGVQKFGRGGILTLASVQARLAGAARTSPVLRGNWVVETLLGEKLPRPPPDVPRLPEEEGATEGLTMRQLVEKHTRVESCAVCHQRIDPFGFSFERYDSIGRLRDKESTGLAIDCRAKLKDGTEFEGLDGLRNYLLTQKKDIILRLFCRRLLGYAMGRSVALSDQPLIDEMMTALNRNDGRVSAAVLEIVASKQFRSIRGSGFSEDD